jgi:hypothetical protein
MVRHILTAFFSALFVFGGAATGAQTTNEAASPASADPASTDVAQCAGVGLIGARVVVSHPVKPRIILDFDGGGMCLDRDYTPPSGLWIMERLNASAQDTIGDCRYFKVWANKLQPSSAIIRRRLPRPRINRSRARRSVHNYGLGRLFPPAKPQGTTGGCDLDSRGAGRRKTLLGHFER